jgi:hypothetical protein
MARQKPGAVRDAILSYLDGKEAAAVDEILVYARSVLGAELPASSVRSYLRLNTPEIFERVAWGRYKLKRKK